MLFLELDASLSSEASIQVYRSRLLGSVSSSTGWYSIFLKAVSTLAQPFCLYACALAPLLQSVTQRPPAVRQPVSSQSHSNRNLSSIMPQQWDSLLYSICYRRGIDGKRQVKASLSTFRCHVIAAEEGYPVMAPIIVMFQGLPSAQHEVKRSSSMA